MTIVLSAPIELENLLPYDFSYAIVDKRKKSSGENQYKGFLRKGQSAPLHNLQINTLLLLNIDPQDTGKFGWRCQW